MRADLLTPAVPVARGSAARLALEVVNTGELIDRVTVDIPALAAEHYRVEPSTLTLFPDEHATVELMVSLPKDFDAGFHELLVAARSLASGDVVERAAMVEVLPAVLPVLELDPARAIGGRRGVLRARVRNDGNTPLEVVLAASDPVQHLRFQIEPPTLQVPAGASAEALVRMKGRRPLSGGALVRDVTVTAEQAPVVVSAGAEFKQKPLIPTGFMTALTLAMIVALWAVAVLFGVRAALAHEDPKRVVPESFSSGGIDPQALDPSVIGGSLGGAVTAGTTGKPIPRVTVEIFDRQGKLTGTTTTKDDGTFAIEGALPGTYTIRFRAGGIDETWFPGVADRGAATSVVVLAGKPTESVALSVVGRPASVGGVVLAGDGPGAPVTIVATPVDLANGVEATPISVQAVSGKPFSIPGLVTPATYRIRATAPGFQSVEIDQLMAPGTDAQINTLRLVAGLGSIAGSVVDTAGLPVGEVKLVTTANGAEVSTVTPTAGSVGQFALVGLPTPGTYLISFGKPGYRSEVTAVALGAGQQRTDVNIVLRPATGSVSGTVKLPDGHGAGDVHVAVIGAAGQLSTSTYTAGTVGGYRLAGLPTPGSYTLAFTLDGYATQTELITLTAEQPERALEITLASATARLHGFVTTDRSGVGGATIEVFDGVQSRNTITASAPAGLVGNYEILGLAPGTYTVTVTTRGYRTMTILLTLKAGDDIDRSLALTGASS